MQRSEVGFLKLAAELKSDYLDFDKLYAKWMLINRKIDNIEPDEFDWAALGYTIHNVYNLLENYFLRIAKFFENSLDTLSWHKDLVRRMAMEIEGVRPALLRAEDVCIFDDLRAFRHVFRNIYQTKLDEEKLNLINSKMPQVKTVFDQRHQSFLEKLDRIRSFLS